MIYNDELYLRIYDGQTGKELFKLANDNGTLVEYPVIASLREGEPASIIFSANSYTSYNGSASVNPGVVEDPALVGAPVVGDLSTTDKNALGNVTGIRVLQLKTPTSSSQMTSLNTKNRINIPVIKTQCQK